MIVICNGEDDQHFLDLLSKHMGEFGEEHMAKITSRFSLFAFSPNTENSATLFFLRSRGEEEYPVLFSVDTNGAWKDMINYGPVMDFVLSEDLPPFSVLQVLLHPDKYENLIRTRGQW